MEEHRLVKQTTLQKELVRLTRGIEQSNSLWRTFVRGIVGGIGGAIGASLIAAIVLTLLLRLVRIAAEVPGVGTVIQRTQLEQLFQRQSPSFRSSPTSPTP